MVAGGWSASSSPPAPVPAPTGPATSGRARSDPATSGPATSGPATASAAVRTVSGRPIRRAGRSDGAHMAASGMARGVLSAGRSRNGPPPAPIGRPGTAGCRPGPPAVNCPSRRRDQDPDTETIGAPVFSNSDRSVTGLVHFATTMMPAPYLAHAYAHRCPFSGEAASRAGPPPPATPATVPAAPAPTRPATRPPTVLSGHCRRRGADHPGRPPLAARRAIGPPVQALARPAAAGAAPARGGRLGSAAGILGRYRRPEQQAVDVGSMAPSRRLPR